MASIERTAYPRFRRFMSQRNLSPWSCQRVECSDRGQFRHRKSGRAGTDQAPAGPGRRHRRPRADADGHRPHRRRRGRTRPRPAGRGPDHRHGAARPAASRAGPGVPGLLRPQGIVRLINPATAAGLGRMAGRAIPARRDRTAAGLHRQPVPAHSDHPAAVPAFRKLDAVAGAHGSIVTGHPQHGGTSSGGHSVWGTEARTAVSRARSISRARAACAG